MQNQNDEQSTAVNYKVTIGDRIWQIIRFAVVSGIIFVISFSVINVQAFKSIIASVIDPETQEAREELLTTAAVGREIDESLLLPVLNGDKDAQKSFDWLDFPIVPTDNRLVIPKIGKSVPIVEMGTENVVGENWDELEEQIQDGLRDGVVLYPGTAKPGQIGNSFITGHSSYYPWDPGKFKDVFALLEQLEIGDEYYVYYNQKKFTYKIREKFEVYPDDVSVLQQPQNERISTLMSCIPVGTTLRRLILRAELMS